MTANQWRSAGGLDALAQELRREMPGCTLLTNKEDVAPYECDDLAAYRQLPLGVVLAESEARVQAVLKLCAHHGIPVVPRGGGTGLSGGAMPLREGVVLSLARMHA
jgi:glycolate oxidase